MRISQECRLGFSSTKKTSLKREFYRTSAHFIVSLDTVDKATQRNVKIIELYPRAKGKKIDYSKAIPIAIFRLQKGGDLRDCERVTCQIRLSESQFFVIEDNKPVVLRVNGRTRDDVKVYDFIKNVVSISGSPMRSHTITGSLPGIIQNYTTNVLRHLSALRTVMSEYDRSNALRGEIEIDPPFRLLLLNNI